MAVSAATPTYRRRQASLTDTSLLFPALGEAVKKLDPRWQVRNPVMFVVEVGAVITSYAWITSFGSHGDPLFVGQIALWLWFTVIFANFAEAVAEGRGKAQGGGAAQDPQRHHRAATARRHRGAGAGARFAQRRPRGL